MYSRKKEDDVEQAFKNIGFELVEDVARRTINKADRILHHPNCNLTLAVDNKSTRNEGGIRITREMLERIRLDAGTDIPILTFTLYGWHRKFAVIEIDELGKFCR